jgi:hypothetical protein
MPQVRRARRPPRGAWSDNGTRPAESVSSWAFALEARPDNGGKRLLSLTFENYFESSLEVIREMLAHEATIVGLGDGGAHVCT